MRRGIYLHPGDVGGKGREKPKLPEEGMKEQIRRQLQSSNPIEQARGLAVVLPKLKAEKREEVKEIFFETLNDIQMPQSTQAFNEILKSLDLETLEAVLRKSIQPEEVVRELSSREELKTLLDNLVNLDDDLLIGLAQGIYEADRSIGSWVVYENAIEPSKERAAEEVKKINFILEKAKPWGGLPATMKLGTVIEGALPGGGVSKETIEVLADSVKVFENWINEQTVSEEKSTVKLTLGDLWKMANAVIFEGGTLKASYLLLKNVSEEKKIRILAEQLATKAKKEHENKNKKALTDILDEISNRGIDPVIKVVVATSKLRILSCREAEELLATRIDELKKNKNLKGLILVARKQPTHEENEKLKGAGFPTSIAEHFGGVPLRKEKGPYGTGWLPNYSDDLGPSLVEVGIKGVDEPLTERQIERLLKIAEDSPSLNSIIQAVDAIAEIDKNVLADLIERKGEVTEMHMPCAMDYSEITSITIRNYVLAKLGHDALKNKKELVPDEILEHISE